MWVKPPGKIKKKKIIPIKMGLRKLHLQTSSLTLSPRKILEQIKKMLAHGEEVSSILWVLSRTSGFQNSDSIIFLL